jgi:branched-chain amino acid transport system permease protein
MVIFSIILLVVVLFYQRGIMGKNEFSWDRLEKRFRKLIASIKGGAKNA